MLVEGIMLTAHIVRHFEVGLASREAREARVFVDEHIGVRTGDEVLILRGWDDEPIGGKSKR